MTRTLLLLGLWLIASATGCAHRPPLDGFEGTWGSPELAYEIHFDGPIGVAVHAKAAGLQDGDPVFRLLSMERGSRPAGCLLTEAGIP
jgi:hypothetical protein